MKPNRLIYSYASVGAVLLGLLIFFSIKAGLFEKEPSVEAVPDNTYSETLYVVTDCDYKPYSFLTKDGEPSGYDVELITHIANELHMNLDLKLMSWEEGIKTVTSGQANILMTCGFSDEFEGVDKLIMSEMTSSDDYVVYSLTPVTSIIALYGKRIAIMKDGNVLPKLEALGLAEYSITFSDNRSAMLALVTGEADVAIMRQAVGTGILETMPRADIKAYIHCGQSYMCYGINATEAGLVKRINHIIEGFKKDGTIERLSDKWLTTFVRPYTVKEILVMNQWVILVVFLLLVYILISSFHRSRQKVKNHIAQAAKDREMQKKLQEALSMAESANKAKTSFLNNMSHDIRTPMNAIVGYTGLAVSHIDNKELVKNYLNKITQSSAHLLSLINDVLDMSHIESGKMHLEEKEENLSEIVHTLKDIVQADIDNKHLDFFVVAQDVADEYVLCDKLRLNQVLLNILSNSIKYTPAGGSITMHIKETPGAEEGFGNYRFVIKDTGMGMSKEFLASIFEPFSRANTSTVSRIQGTGLGMAITKSIVDMMGGKIDIQSEQGKGTEVTIDFCFKLKVTKEVPLEMPDLSGVKALIVDDDINGCLASSRMFKDLDVRNEWCTSGKEAIVRAKEAARSDEAFNFYLLDCLMPDMNGVDVARRIRKHVGNEIPIILLTAYDLSYIEDEARDAGVTECISKPLFPSDLQKVLCRCFGDETTQPQTEEYDLSGKKILLVEDNEINREIATMVLEEYGCEVIPAEDGDIAVAKMKEAKQGDYDIVLMDIQMPTIDGYEATRQIRALGTDISSIPILAMTANAFEEDRKAAIEAGMNEHIAKPLDIVKLKAILARYLLNE